METDNKNKEPEIKPEKQKKKHSLSYFFGGSLLTEDFIIKQSGLLILVFFLILLFISNRYYCSKKLTEMDKLKRELVDLNYEQVFLTTRLTAISRQSQIEELLRKKEIELTKGNATVYQIRK
jgi:hypothetical protein